MVPRLRARSYYIARTPVHNPGRSLAIGPVVTNFSLTVKCRCLISEVQLAVQTSLTAEQERAGVTTADDELRAVSLDE